jgi:hypothetical protein
VNIAQISKLNFGLEKKEETVGNMVMLLKRDPQGN